MGKKTLGLLLSCLMCTFIGVGGAFTTTAQADSEPATPSVAETEQAEDVAEPRFGGKSYASARLRNSAGLSNGMTLYVKAYAENYVWPMTDKGHVYLLLHWDPNLMETGFDSGEKGTVTVSMQYDWGNDTSSIIHWQTFTMTPDGVILSQYSSPDDYPYEVEMKSSCKDYNGTGNGNASCYCIWVSASVMFPGGFTASVPEVMATF